MTGPFAIEWHEGVEPLEREWDALADRTAADPFRRPGWIGAWHESFGKGRLAIVAARRGGDLAAVIPFERRGRVVEAPTNWHTPFFGPVSESVEATAALASATLAERPHGISLSFVASSDPLREALLRRAGAAGYRTLDLNMQRSPYLRLEGGWEKHWQGLTSKRRTNLKRRRRRLEEQGELTLEVVERGDGVEAALEEGLRVEALGWKGEDRTAIVSTPETHGFYRRIAAWAAARGILRLGLLRVDRRLVAFDFALEAGGHHYLLKTGFDPAFKAGAPGIVMRTMMIERAHSLGLESYEFLGGKDEYKLEWTDLAHDIRRLQAFAPSAQGRVRWLAFRYGRPAAKRGLRWLGR